MTASVPENPGITTKPNMSIIWVSKPEIQANASRNQDQGVCYRRQMPETRTVCLESGPRSLKSRQISRETRVKMLEIKVNVYKTQGQRSLKSLVKNRDQYAYNMGQYT